MRLPSLRRDRRGFTMNEMLIAMVILGVIGIAFTKMLTVQTRFMKDTANRRAATSVSRTAMNVLLADLRMVQDSGGIDSAASNGRFIRLRVPYRFGLVCGSTGTVTTVSMLPIDSGSISMATYGGYAYRVASSKRYVVVTPADPTGADIFVNSASTPKCTGNGAGQARISTVSLNGRTGAVIDVKPPSAAAAQGTAVFFWQRVSYSFATSTAYPGKMGLWRQVEGQSREEIMGPFGSGTRFRFYTDTVTPDTSRRTVPNLANIRGIELVLPGQSPTAAGASLRTSRLQTAIFFKNTRSP
jgi:prepilin-type N-terminal cleavage/methylation domain-containing protein